MDTNVRCSTCTEDRAHRELMDDYAIEGDCMCPEKSPIGLKWWAELLVSVLLVVGITGCGPEDIAARRNEALQDECARDAGYLERHNKKIASCERTAGCTPLQTDLNYRDSLRKRLDWDCKIIYLPDGTEKFP